MITLKKSLIIARDRFGIKPLYYYHDDNKFIFSSEIKGILSSGLVKADFEENAIDEYLANRYVREPFTFFKNIFQVKSSNLILIDSNLNIESKKFWNITDKFNLEKEYDETKILNKFRNEIEKSIEYRQVADVEVGTYLSGGLDSSIITAYTSIMSNKTLNSYTIGFRDLNEFEYSDIVANKFKTCHHKILLKEDYLKNWNELIRFKDSPLGVPNEIPLAIMSNKLKEKITVVLSGEGADELMVAMVEFLEARLIFQILK